MKHLRYFKALAQQGHFGRAAEVCAISQPALSVQVKELEEVLGGQLVERGARHIHLTGLGRAIADRIDDILRSVDELGEYVRASHSPLVGGLLRIGVIPTIAPYLLPSVIRELTQIYQGLDLRPREAVTKKLIEKLVDAQLDAAIVALPVSEASLIEFPLFDEEFVLVRPLKDAEKSVPNIEMLRNMKLLLLEEGHCFRDQALSFCKISPSVQRHMIEGSSLSTLVQMVGSGIGVTLIPEMAVPIETCSATVSVARLPQPRPSRTIGMVWRKTNPLSEQLTHIADIIRQIGTVNIGRNLR